MLFIPKQRIIKCSLKRVFNEQLKEKSYKKNSGFQQEKKFYHFLTKQKESLYSEIQKHNKLIYSKHNKNNFFYIFSAEKITASVKNLLLFRLVHNSFYNRSHPFFDTSPFRKYKMSITNETGRKTTVNEQKKEDINNNNIHTKSLKTDVKTGEEEPLSSEIEIKENDKTTEAVRMKQVELTENAEKVNDNKNGQQNKLYTVSELKKIKEKTNFCIINETKEEINIYISYDHKELKLLRKKNESLNSSINRLILNLRKLQAKQNGMVKAGKRKREKVVEKKEKNMRNQNVNTTEIIYTEYEEKKKEEADENVYMIHFYDKENKEINENELLKDILHKMDYLKINDLKILIFSNVYDLQQIHVSMDVYNGHPIILVNLPLQQMDEYAYYWINADEPDKVKSCNLFYKPTVDDVSKNLQFVIYNKKCPFFSHRTKEIQVNHSTYETDLIKKNEQRFIDFGKTENNTNAAGDTDQTYDSIVRILSYNILAPTYTNTEYFLTYMVKNMDPLFLKTSYRSHLLLNDINLDFDILSLQEVSEYLHVHLFSIFLNEKYYCNYFAKNSFGSDGCSLFVKKKKFQQIEIKNYKFNQVVKENIFKDVYDVFNGLTENRADSLLSDINTVYQIGIYLHTHKDVIFLIANTHFYFHTLAAHIRILQSYTILYLLQSLKDECQKKYDKEVHVVLCGDFNASFDSEVFRFFEGNDVNTDSEVWKYAKVFKKEYDDLNTYPQFLNANLDNIVQVKGPFLNRKQFFHLFSAYKKNDIEFTNWNNNFIDVLDYIFLSSGFKVRKILKGVDKQDFMKYKGLLSPIHPSDHLSIGVEVEL